MPVAAASGDSRALHGECVLSVVLQVDNAAS